MSSIIHENNVKNRRKKETKNVKKILLADIELHIILFYQ
jgi:hypothetical protein